MHGFSDRNVDYGNLWRLLRQKRWKEANEETLLKLLEASARIETLVASGKLSSKGMSVLFQLFDTGGRLKMLEALAKSKCLEDKDGQKEIKALLNLLDPSDREFYLPKAIETSENLAPEEKRKLHQLIDLQSSIKLQPSPPPSRQELFKSFVLGWEEEDWHLLRGDIELCPCRDLQTIDSFWSTLSSGRFGFSVQGQIWVAVRGNLEHFSQIVGWRKNNTWINYGSVTFALQPGKTYSIENARYGHLPFFPRMGWWHWTGGMDAIIKRLLCCNCLSEPEPNPDQPLDSCNWLPAADYLVPSDRWIADCTNPPCPFNTQPCPCTIFSSQN
jgi:hypothetical protein